MPLNIVELELIQRLSRYRNPKPLRHYPVKPVPYPMRMSASPIFNPNHSSILMHQIIRCLMTNLKHLSTFSLSDKLLQSTQQDRRYWNRFPRFPPRLIGGWRIPLSSYPEISILPFDILNHDTWQVVSFLISSYRLCSSKLVINVEAEETEMLQVFLLGNGEDLREALACKIDLMLGIALQFSPGVRIANIRT